MQNPNLVADIQNKAMEFMCCVLNLRELSRRIIKRVRREKPPPGWAKLNIKGAAMGNSSLAGCKGWSGMNIVHGLLDSLGILGQLPAMQLNCGASEMD